MTPTTTSPRRAGSRRCARRNSGLTFLEAVLAMALLAMAFATTAAGINFVVGRQSNERHRLACVEIANRLILQHLDDDDALPSQSTDIVYDGSRYRYRLSLQKVELRENDLVGRAQSARTSSGGVTRDRLIMISVTVFLTEDVGGRAPNPADVPTVTLTRVYDPLSLQRNPDSADNLIQSPDGIRELIDLITNLSNDSVTRTGNDGSDSGGGGRPGGER